MKYFGFFKNKLKMNNGPDGYRITEDAIWLSSVLPLDKKNYLEVGCASGVISFILSLKNTNSYIKSIDIQSKLVQRAEELKTLNNIKNVNFECKDLFDLSIGNKKYECVFSNPPFFDDKKTQKSHDETRSKAHFQPRMIDFVQKMLDLTLENGVLCFMGHKSTRDDVLSLISQKYDVLEIALKSSPSKEPKRFIYIVKKIRNKKFSSIVVNAYDENIRKDILFDYKDLKFM